MQNLSKKLGVSPKTIQLDLAKLEDWLYGKELKLIRKTGQG
ncbi:MAG: HTH domain-containing protein, partial [Clostridia bacterium]|nr:HTH domain-containing protein [Clostridia bacterium]